MKRKEAIDKVKRAMLAMQRYPWEQGVASQAILALGDYELTFLMARDAVLRQSHEGRLGTAFFKDDVAIMGDDYTVTDPAANGEAVLYVAETTGDRLFKDAIQKQVDWLIKEAPRTGDGVLSHVISKKQVWVDSIFMAIPILSMTGYHREAIKQIEGFKKVLWDVDKKLFSHIWDDELKKFLDKHFWGVGNGWAATGIAKVINSLPDNMPDEKKKLASLVKELIDGCLHYQRKDGLFHNIIDDQSTFIETNLAQMISYTIYLGVEGGWLDSGYLQHANKMREAVYEKVDEHGLVQGVCSSPTFAAPGTAVEGQAFFLLMEVAASKFDSD